MEKDFDNWNEIKKDLEKNDKSIVIKERDIWWVNIWLNVKTESCGKWEKFRRPVLVLKKLSHENYIVIPLSTKIKTWTWFENYTIDWVEYTALLYQIKMLNINRFYLFEYKMPYEKFLEIKKRLKQLLNL